jgi:NDP-sugar pyrophosphorylase family protein
MSKLQGLIPAAGKGVRARPYTHETHKGMLDINGSPNIQRIIEIMRDQLLIREIVIVVGYLGDSIKTYFGDGSQFGVKIDYVNNSELDKGLAWSIYLSRNCISSEHFCIMLCDECYINSNHSELLTFPYQKYLVTCCGMPVDDNTLIQRNFAICLDADQQITRLQEKPRILTSRIMGSGTFVCKRDIFNYLETAFDKSNNEFIDFVSTLDQIHKQNKSLGYFQIDGTYVNINDRDSLYLAKYHERIRHFADRSIGLIVYSEGKEENIAFTLQRYSELNIFESISVVLPSNNSIEDIVNNCGAKPIICPENIRLYGEKLKYAMEMADEEIIILTEADYSFSSRDIEKLLAYLPEADMVIGTRTTRQLIEQGSTMRGLVRFANALLGRLVEFLWWNRRSRFTDVGCTFRAIWKTSFNSVKDNLTSNGPEFSAEMMIALLNQHQRVIEIPVNYFNRSQSIHRKYQTISTFFRFITLILSKRLEFKGTDKNK